MQPQCLGGDPLARFFACTHAMALSLVPPAQSAADSRYDSQAWEQLTLHSHNAANVGQDSHMQAAPSQAEILLREFKDKKAAAAGRSKVCAARPVCLTSSGPR